MIFDISEKYSRAPATQIEIDNVLSSIRINIPQPIIELWMQSNGLINDEGILIYATDELQERNATMEVQEYDSSLLMIGDDSGGHGFFLNINDISDTGVYFLDFGSIGSLQPQRISDNFYNWINSSFS